MNLILKAIDFAKKKHAGQKRRGSGEPYVTHPVTVSYLVAQFKRSQHLEELIAASLLHDTLEDTATTFNELAKEFTPLVASLVFDLTSDPKEVERLGKNEYLKRKMLGISSYALVIKLADRLHNVLDQPKPSYVTDTVELMAFLRRARRLSRTQKKLVQEILSRCTAG